MNRIRKIDIHAHATAFPDYFPKHYYSKQRMPSAEEVLAFYDKLDIEAGVLLAISAAEGQCSNLSGENCKFLSDRYPERFFWFCGVDPRAGQNTPNADLTYFLSHYKSLGARGVGELTANLYADDPLTENLFAHAEGMNMPVTIHISPAPGVGYGIIDDLGLPRLEGILKRHPKLKILGHSQPFWAEMSNDVTNENRNGYPKGAVTPGRLWQLMETYENLYCDLSAGSGMNALRRDPKNAAAFLKAFSSRILYGCDICAVTNTHPFEFNDFLNDMLEKHLLSEADYKKIVRNNAIDLLNLPLEKA